MIDIAVLAGCDYVKFQKRDVESVYTAEELNRPRISPWGTTNRAQKEGLEFCLAEYDEINTYCKEKKIQWFASPWDSSSVGFLARFKPPFIKIASASITDFDILQAVKETKIPAILSTGMSSNAEVCKAIALLGKQVEYILACTSTYPTKPEEVNLNFIKTLQKEFPTINTGFSNHHAGTLFPVVAMALGAKMIEFHITLDRSMYGSDQAASIELPGMLKIIQYVRDLKLAMGSGAWTVYESEEKIKKKLRKK